MLLENMDTDSLTALEEQVLSAIRRTQKTTGAAAGREECLEAFCSELEFREIPFERDIWQAEEVSAMQLNVGYVIDVLVDGRIVVDAMAAPVISREDEVRLLSLLSLGGRRLGFIVNFGARHGDEGIRKLYYEDQPQMA